MIVLLVNMGADEQEKQRIKQAEHVIRQRRNFAVNHNHTEVFDKHIHRIQKKHFSLPRLLELIDGIKDGREVG